MIGLEGVVAYLTHPTWEWLWALAGGSLFFLPRRRRARDMMAPASGQGDLISRIERMRGTRVIGIVHRDMPSERDYPRDRVEGDTAEELLSMLRRIKPDQAIDIILHTPGGMTTPSVQIAHALKAHRGRKTAFVPYHAFSAGTLIALTADEIVMGDHAVLGPIDPQVGGWPASAFVRLRSEKPVERIEDQALLISYIAEQVIEESRVHACALVNDVHKRDGTCAITDELGRGDLTHGYPITAIEAKERGINASTGVPDLIYEFVDATRDPAAPPAILHR